jgi:hypothetical protein
MSRIERAVRGLVFNATDLSVNLSKWRSLRKRPAPPRCDAAAALAAFARAGVAAWRMAGTRAQSHSRRWHLRLRLIGCARRVQLLTALVAIVTALIPRALRETQPKSVGLMSAVASVVRGVVTWIFLVGMVGLPYWIVLIPLHDLLLGNELRRQLAQSPALWLTFGSLAAGHFWKAFQSGYDAIPDNELKQRVRWDVYLLVLRALAMFMMAAHGLAFIVVPLMALLLSYFEIWPERALGAVFGDPSRLYEYDPDDPASSRRRR